MKNIIITILLSMAFTGCYFEKSNQIEIVPKILELSSSSAKESSYDKANLFVKTVEKRETAEKKEKKTIEISSVRIVSKNIDIKQKTVESIDSFLELSKLKISKKAQRKLSVLIKEKENTIIAFIKIEDIKTKEKISKKAIYYKEEDGNYFKLFLIEELQRANSN